METSFIYWDLGPIIVNLGPISLRWYGVLFASGFLLGYYLVRWMYRVEQKPEADLDRLLLYMLAGTVVGARLGHCLFYDPAYYLSRPWEIIMVWQGGLASHGGAVGIFTALYFFSRKRPDQPYLWLLDRIAVPTALAGCFIRLGNLFNSEILGTPTDVSWAFIFARIDQVPRHPAQLYESVSYLLIFIVLLLVYRRYHANLPRGLTTGLFLLLIFTARFLIEFVKVRQAAFAEVLPFSMGQLLSMPLVLVGLYLLTRAFGESGEASRRSGSPRYES